jgi:hypothetical protein
MSCDILDIAILYCKKDSGKSHFTVCELFSGHSMKPYGSDNIKVAEDMRDDLILISDFETRGLSGRG